jgi:hypothetical protein
MMSLTQKMEEVEYLYHRNAKCGCFRRETWDLPSAHDLVEWLHEIPIMDSVLKNK